MAWKERPVDFVSTFGATIVNGLGISTAFGFCDYDTEVISGHWTGSGEVHSHISSVTYRISPYNAVYCATMSRERVYPRLFENLMLTDSLKRRTISGRQSNSHVVYGV